MRDTSQKPNIYSQLSLRLSGKQLQRGTLILKHFDRGNDMIWDEYGDIYSPINGYNVIDFIYDLTSLEPIKNREKLRDYAYLIKSSSLPLHYIKNNKIKDYLSENWTGGGGARTKKNKVCGWMCY